MSRSASPNNPSCFIRVALLLLVAAVVVPSSTNAFVALGSRHNSIISANSGNACSSLGTRRRTPLMALAAAKPNNQKNKQQQKNKKPPRFTQQAHKNQEQEQRQSDKKTKKTKKKREVWDSGKSIDDLESTMLKRWGTLNDPAKRGSSGGGGLGIKKEKTSGRSNKSISKKDGGGLKNRRPVLDPWQKEEKREQLPNAKSDFLDNNDWTIIDEEDDGYDDDDVIIVDEMEEYYDHDDEGYESSSSRKNSSNNKDLSISHLISPKPAGGRGSTQQQQEEESSNTSYFFNPNRKSLSSSSSDTVSGHSTKNSIGDTRDNPASTKENQKPRSPKQTPLLDEDGNEVLMTVDEAMRRFEESNSLPFSMMSNDDEDEEDDIQSSLSVSSWEDAGIIDTKLRQNLEEYMDCPAPLSVQQKSCPAILTGNDLLMGTYTGSGKTLAFLVPLVQQLIWNSNEGDDEEENKKLSIIIVAPGRELASQIVSVARELLEDTPLKVQLAIGGTTFSRNLEQIRKRKPNILVGTPGRIAELVVGKPGEKRGRLNIANLNGLVLDEVDALLEYKPHREPTRAILHTCKRRHRDGLQTVLCSATVLDVEDTAKEFLRPGYATAMADKDDVLVTSSGGGKTKNIKTKVSRTVLHGVIHLPEKRGLKMEIVRKILHTEPIPQQILIFVDTSRKVDIVVEKLAARGILAAALHGGMGSEKLDRAEVAKALREGYVGIVVATELAARGIDAPYLTHVINMDLPTDASHYAHRAGRCGRGGRPGVVINITTNPKERNVPERFANSLGIEMHDVEPRGGKLLMLERTAASST